MAYTEKVSISGTALAFLLYECINSENTQEGFLIGDVTSKITNHISDSQSDNTRLDIQVSITAVLPLPSISLFYFPTGRIKEDIVSDILSTAAKDVIGWFKYRKDSCLKPTFRDKLITRGLQKFFEKYHNKKNFVVCNLSNKISSTGSTHTLVYKFGKINCLDMYEYLEDVTPNLGEKHTGYKKIKSPVPHSSFNRIINETDIQNSRGSEAIFRIQEAVNMKLDQEAKIAAENETKIKELQAEIKQMSSILSDKQTMDLQIAFNKMLEEKLNNKEVEMAKACLEALHAPPQLDMLNTPKFLIKRDPLYKSNNIVVNHNDFLDSIPLPATSPPTTTRQKRKNEATSTKQSNNLNEDLISFAVDDEIIKRDINNTGGSPEY